MFRAIVAIVLTLILAVGIHEAGHAVAAWVFKVRIKRISIGFGKALLSWTDKSQRHWVWSLWPLGGYVRLLNARIEPVSPTEFTFCFDKKPVWVRCTILAAGAMANLLTAWLALTLMFILGYPQQAPVIEAVSPQTIAAQAGLAAGDRFTAVAGQTTNSWQEVGMSFIMALGHAKVPVQVKNNKNESRELVLNLQQWPLKPRSSLLDGLGIKPSSSILLKEQVSGQSVFYSAYLAMVKCFYFIHFFIILLKQLMMGVIPFTILLGPLGLFAASVNSFLQGMALFLYFIASLSLAIGLVNLLPIPGLDGGSIIYALIEKIRGQPISVALEILLYRLAIIAATLLLVQLVLNDLQRYFGTTP